MSLNITSSSPPVTTLRCEPPTVGQGKNLAPVPTWTLPDFWISPATKSPSYSIAAFPVAPNTSATDWVKLSWVPPFSTKLGCLK